MGFACTLVFAVAIVSIALVGYSKSRHIYLDAYGGKTEMLKDTPSPRAIFLGGSNLAFGLDSKAVADSLNLNVVNYGLQAGLGLKLMLNDALGNCRNGDILVISPEYEHFYGNAHGEKNTLAVVTLLYPEIVRRFDAGNFKVVSEGFVSALTILGDNIKSKMSAPDPAKYIYSALSFNAYGDEARHWTYPKEGLTVYANALADEFDEEFFNEFVEYVKALEAKGVVVVIVPPSIIREFYDNYASEIRYIEMRLAEEGLAFAYPQEKSVYAGEDMFDSYYHLSRTGIDKRMNLIIPALSGRQKAEAASRDSH